MRSCEMVFIHLFLCLPRFRRPPRLLCSGSLYLSVKPKFYTEVLHQTLNPTADELWRKTLSRIKVDLVLHRT